MNTKQNRKPPAGGRDDGAEGQTLYPSDIEAEQAVLGSVLIDPVALCTVADYLQPEDFYRDAHRVIYQAALELYERQEPADLITLADKLRRAGKLEEVGGRSYVGSLANQVPTSANVDAYGRIVERKALARRIVHQGEQLVGLGYDEPEDLAGRFAYEHALMGDVVQSTRAKSRQEFRFLTATQAMALPPATANLGHILFEGETVAVSGESDVYKTFVTLSWGCCLDAGVSWLGLPEVRQGVAIHVAAEAPVTIGGRIEGWLKHFRPDGAESGVILVPSPVNLMDHQSVRQFINEATVVLDGRRLGLVTFDTLGRSMDGGDPNTDRDMGVVFASFDLLHAAWPTATVAYVDHPGKDPARGMSGSYKKRAHTDVIIEVTRTGPQTIQLHCEKNKDRPTWADIHLTALHVETSRPSGTLVLVRADAASVPTLLSGGDLDTLKALYGEGGRPEGLNHDAWKQCAAGEPYSVPPGSFDGHVRRLTDSQYVHKPGRRGGLYFVLPKGLRVIPSARLAPQQEQPPLMPT